LAIPVEDEFRLRHLTDIQVAIERLSQHSFVIRGWSLTLVSLVLAFLSRQGPHSAALAALALVPALVFWGLDAYYLRRERLFRQLYVAAARRLLEGPNGPDVKPFDMDVDKYRELTPRFVETLFVGHVIAVPATLIVLTVALTLASL
jgi:hypothetical protein